jgi:hypothetical protein
MKKLHTLLAVILITATTFAQVPESMSYQATVRDSGGNLVSNLPVGMQISILQGSSSGTVVYAENHTESTNVNGLVTLEIGLGTATTGTFAIIDWAAGPYFIKTETDPTGGTNYTITGTSQLMSVPYALYAKTSGSSIYNVNTVYPELGGYVIEISPNGKHGLVVAMQDQGNSNWYTANDLLSNAANHDANGAEFKDWRLPTKRELNLMYLVYSNGNGANLNAIIYWSSTELDSNIAWGQVFSNGYQGYYYKNNSFYVRAVRAF